MFRKNIDTKGRWIRFGIGVVFLGIAWLLSSWILFIVALFSFYQAAFSWCLFYQLTGKNSCPIDKR